ncbi:MAG: hypothetical protein CMH63_03665 [Nanoarchaeota archaeon]|nr:hypothetical protein [Nanoarchaeota archaeon]|tara:strand:+ start:19 stop:765 length:747 start_codon:yes stop_codon:yes gene_type:complete
MNKKGIMFATLTVIVMAGFVMGLSMRKEKILEETKIIEVGKVPEAVLYFALEEEKIDFFIQKAVEVSAYKALAKLGENGGLYQLEEGCMRVEKSVVWTKDCIFSGILPEIFFWYFEDEFKEYVKEYGLKEFRSDWNKDENGNYVEVEGDVVLIHEGTSYGFESKVKYYLDYDFKNYNRIKGFALSCVRKENENIEISRNYLYEECRDNKDFKWEIALDENKEYVLFNATSLKPYQGWREIRIGFGLPK